MAKRLAGMNIRQMQFDGRNGDRADGVHQRHGGMGIGTRVKDDPIICAARRVDRIEQRAFVVALVKCDGHAALTGGILTCRFYISEGCTPIHFGLARAEKIEVWSVQKENCGHGKTPACHS